MKKGIVLFTLEKRLGDREKMYEALKRVKEMGYEAVQYNTPRYMTREDYKGMLDEFGLPSLCVGASYDDMLREQAAVDKAVELADFFGTSYIDVNTLPAEFRSTADGFKRYARNLNLIAQRLEGSGKTLLYHNHALEFISLGGGRKGMDILIEETDPRGVHFILDTHWLACGGVIPADWIQKVKGRMKIIHFKDYAIVPAEGQKVEALNKQFAEVGEGNIDWKQVVEACKATGVEYAVVEQDICLRDPFDCAQTSYDNMVRFGVS